jgi:putative flippase GtrA
MTAFFRFGLLSALSFGLNFGLTSLFHEVAGLWEPASFAISLVIVSVINFIGCRHFVFESQEGSLWWQILTFYASWLPFRGIEWVLFVVLNEWMGLDYRLAMILVQGVSFAVKFVYFRVAVFRRSSAGSSRPAVGSHEEPVAPSATREVPNP